MHFHGRSLIEHKSHDSTHYYTSELLKHHIPWLLSIFLSLQLKYTAMFSVTQCNKYLRRTLITNWKSNFSHICCLLYQYVPDKYLWYQQQTMHNIIGNYLQTSTKDSSQEDICRYHWTHRKHEGKCLHMCAADTLAPVQRLRNYRPEQCHYRACSIRQMLFR